MAKDYSLLFFSFLEVFKGSLLGLIIQNELKDILAKDCLLIFFYFFFNRKLGKMKRLPFPWPRRSNQPQLFLGSAKSKYVEEYQIEEKTLIITHKYHEKPALSNIRK